MTVKSTLEGAGYHNFKGVIDWLYLLLYPLFPPYTLIMSGYDLSAFALTFGTVFLIVARRFEKGSWRISLRPDRRTQPS